MEDRMNILVVDNIEMNREILKSTLDDKYNVYQAEDGNTAIEMIKGGERIYRVILLALDIPGIDGFGVLEYMNENNLIADIPVIITTSVIDKESMIKAYSLGATDVFQVPYVPEIINKRIENVIKAYRRNYRDMLTGAYNRKAFIREVTFFLKNVDDISQYSIMYFNIKNFKAVNEMFGTTGGDYILKCFYEDVFLDTIKADYVSRLEADHFVCIVKTSEVDLGRLSKKMEKNFIINDKKIKVYARFGVYNLSKDDKDVPIMIDRARLAKLRIVDESVRPYQIYQESMKSDYVDQAEVLAEFEDAIINREFQVYYQPVIEAKTGKIVSAEALVRWFHPKKGFISPAAFIPALEKNGHITKLDRYVMDRVSEDITQREKSGDRIIPISINLSWMDFHDDSMVTALINKIGEKDISSDKIRLEVTETSYAALEDNRVNLIQNLRHCGATILLDDFGTGYSSFALLEDYNFDILKIDMSFVRKIESRDKSRIIIKGIIDMCHSMGIKTVAEGAETEAQVQFLRDNGCDYIQGYYFSKPLPKSEFEEFIVKH